jgi:hypothetical protein
MSAPPVNKQAVIDALVLVFSRSKLREVVGTDALKVVLDVQYREMLRGSELHLEPLWSLLVEQPGFDEQAARPPIARFKRLGERLGITVVLPSAMASCDDLEIAALSAGCEVAESDVDKIVRQHDPTLAAEREAKRAAAIDAALDAQPRVVSAGTRLPVLIVAAVVALGAFGFTGWQVYQAFAGPTVSFQPLQIQIEGMPIKEATRRQNEGVIKLSDDGWLRKPAADRESMLSRALDQASSHGIDVLVVMDTGGAIRASAQYLRQGSERKVKVRFQ